MTNDSSAAAPSAPAQKRRRTNDERRRDSDKRLLDAGLRIVARKGAAGATLAEIGVEAGFSRSLPVERFGSKVNFLRALIDRTEVWFNQRAFADVEGKRGLEAVLARTEAHLRSAAASWDATSALFLLYFESLTVIPELRPRVAALGTAYRTALSDLIREGQQRREIRPDVDPELEAMALFSAIRGAIAQWVFEPENIDLGLIAQSLKRNIVASMALPAPDRPAATSSARSIAP